MKLVYVLLLLMLFLWFYFNGPAIASWITGALILLIVTAKLFSGAVSVGKSAGKELTRDMETDMEKAKPKHPSGEYLTEVVKETGRKTGEALAPQDYTYKMKNSWSRAGQGAKNFWHGLSRLFRKDE